ncbi:MAG: type IX secretion system membrane protein PorP/SprF [Bacteroidales bacterium]|jgi:hypothetical protein|nr:type IX secretion system membrane protein PorP/SprF [Bacteroidales bacterium]
MQAYNDLTATVTYQNYLFGFEQPPAYYYVSCASPIKTRQKAQTMFVGGVVSAKTYGVSMELLAHLDYAYIFKLHEKISLSLGVNGGVEYSQHEFQRLYNDYYFNGNNNSRQFDDYNRKEVRFTGKASVNILLFNSLYVGGYTSIEGDWNFGANIEWHKALNKERGL